MRVLRKGEGYLTCPLCINSALTKRGLAIHNSRMQKDDILPPDITRLFEPYAEKLPPAFLTRRSGIIRKKGA